MERERIRSIIESLLFVSGEPLTVERMAQVLKEEGRKELREALEELTAELANAGRGLRIVEVAGGYQLQTAKDNAEWLARLVKTRPIRLTRPSLETLAIIAYRQPVTRIEVDQIRGVDSSGVVKTLLDYGFIQVVGRKEVPGRPLVYGSSKKFLEFFRLKSLADLPSLEEFVSQAEQAGESGLFESRYEDQKPAVPPAQAGPPDQEAVSAPAEAAAPAAPAGEESSPTPEPEPTPDSEEKPSEEG